MPEERDEAGFEPVRTIVLREIRLPLREPFKISSGLVHERRIGLLELRDGNGFEAWSECVAMAKPNYMPETLDTAWLAIREWVAPRILGRSFASLDAIHPHLETNFRGHAMAKAAVEMGCWALEATRRGRSLSQLLGGTRSEIRTGISLGIQENPAQLVEKVRRAHEEGYAKVKVKIEPGADLEYLGAIREELGPDPEIMADANSAYTLADLETLRAFDRFGLMMIEQPLAWDDLVRHAELQKHLATPLCLDESITDVNRAEDMIALGSGRIINIKPGRVGGLGSSRAIHDLCRAQGIDVWCGGMLESGIGRAYNVALASLPGFTLPGDVSPSARYWQQDIVTPEWTMSPAGKVSVPRDRPGLGVDVDHDRIERLTVRTEELSA